MRLRHLLCYGLLMGLASAASGQVFPSLGGQRAGISALTFLKVDVNPRSAALGGASLCLTGDAYSPATNPAALAEAEGTTAAVATSRWMGGVNFGYASVGKTMKFGSLALSAQGFSSGAMEVRTEFQPNGTGEVFYASGAKVAATYSKRLTDMFSYGVTAGLVYESLNQMKAYTPVVDLAFLYQTDFRDLRFAVMLQNFGPNTSLRGTVPQDSVFPGRTRSIDQYPAPTVFRLGLSATAWEDTVSNQKLTANLQLSHPNDNAESLHFGLEYAWKNLLMLRAGYKLGVKDQSYPTAGVGLRTRMGGSQMRIDYAFEPFTYTGVSHRLGLQWMIVGK